MRSLLLIAIGLCVSLPASGQVRPMGFEASAYVGGWEGDAVLDSGTSAGARLQFNLTRLFGVEATVGSVGTQKLERPQAGIAETDSVDLTMFGFDGILHLSYGQFVPYVTAGVGSVSIDETHFATNAGFGATYHFNDTIGARVDGRGWFSGSAPSTDRFHHFEATVGLVVQFMGSSDFDKDGIDGATDLCPNVPEDKDGFEDSDGCPDPDNDKDGIDDADDKCANEAEDKDSFQDEDGCPDPDNDGDGVLDAADKCADGLEDKDGFQDDDGCPDEDNDGDGIKDADDKCADVAEDKDGFEDADGCLDEDNDQDGIKDADDKCPMEPEDKDGDADEDGCPDVEGSEEGSETDSRLWIPNGVGPRFA